MSSRRRLLFSEILAIYSLACIWSLSALLLFHQASASVFSDLPTRLGEALDVSNYVAGMILACAAIVSLALVLAVAHVPTIGIVIPLLALMILLTAVGWLDKVVTVFAGLVVAIYFGMVMKGIWTTGGGS